MPDTVHGPTYIMEYGSTMIPEGFYMDTVSVPFGDNFTAQYLGPQYIASRLYQLSLPENVELAYSLARPTSAFFGDLASRSPFTNEGYGSVKRAFIHTTKDRAQIPEFQLWLIENNPVSILKVIDSDHMVMISRPQELCQYLVDIANEVDLKYPSL